MLAHLWEDLTAKALGRVNGWWEEGEEGDLSAWTHWVLLNFFSRYMHY